MAAAAADLNALNPTTFAQFQSDLAKAESHSHVNQAQVDQLAQDEAALDQTIQSAGLHPTTTLGHLDLQDVVAGSFRESPSQLARKRSSAGQVRRRGAGRDPARRPDDRADASGLPGDPDSAAVLRRRVVGLAGPRRRAGPNPDTNLGPGAADRDPLDVYYDGQVDNFIKG